MRLTHKLQVKRLLEEHSHTLATAESLTGGAIAADFVSMPGVSSLFRGGVVAYQEDVKQLMLEVPNRVLTEHGVVSEEVASKMAEGARLVLGSDWAVSTTGVAGPTGGTEECPVGMVCFGVARPDGTVDAFTDQFGSLSRSKVRRAASRRAFALLWTAMFDFYNRTVGDTCEKCGATEDNMRFGADPYASEILDDHTNLYLCKVCFAASCEEV